jgi:hypothetical protein
LARFSDRTVSRVPSPPARIIAIVVIVLFFPCWNVCLLDLPRF